jgi:hypothetical protein
MHTAGADKASETSHAEGRRTRRREARRSEQGETRKEGRKEETKEKESENKNTQHTALFAATREGCWKGKGAVRN